jgi:hypothetical protein
VVELRSPNGNPDLVTDTTGAVTDYDPNSPGTTGAGTPLRIHDANGNPPTVFEDYDLYGHKTQIRDPLDNLTRRGYHPDGRLAFIQDPNHQDDSPATNHPGGGFATTASFDAMDR